MNACPCCGFTADKRTPAEVSKLVRMSKKERALFDIFARRFGHSMDAEDLIDAVYADDRDGGPDTAISCLGVIVSRLRKKLEPFGLTIEGKMGSGGSRRMIWKDVQ